MFKQNWEKSSTWQISSMGCLLVSRIFASSKTCITISILYFFTFCNQTMAYLWLLHALKVESFVTMIKPLNYCCQLLQTPIKCEKKPWILFKSLKKSRPKVTHGFELNIEVSPAPPFNRHISKVYQTKANCIEKHIKENINDIRNI